MYNCTLCNRMWTKDSLAKLLESIILSNAFAQPMALTIKFIAKYAEDEEKEKTQ